MLISRFQVSLILVLLPLMVSCVSEPKPLQQTDEYQVLWPEPPEVPRFQYLTSFTSSDDLVVKGAEERLREMVVGRLTPQYIIKRPLVVASGYGKLYLIDAQTPVIHVFDLARRRYFSMGYRLEGKLEKPVGIALDGRGLVYVADRSRRSVIVFDSIGLYQRHIDLDGITTQLAGLAVDRQSNTLYVVDRGGLDSDRHQLVKMNEAGEVVAKIGVRGAEPGRFNLPVDVAVDSKGQVYVLDAGNFRVQVFDAQGQYIRSWGAVGNGLGQFGQPRSIAIDSEDLVYISDTQFGNVQVFNLEGQLLLPIGRLSHEKKPGHFSLVTGIDVGEKGFLYVLDQFVGKMEIYRKLTQPEQQRILRESEAQVSDIDAGGKVNPQ